MYVCGVYIYIERKYVSLPWLAFPASTGCVMNVKVTRTEEAEDEDMLVRNLY
jgi:hypothetical protein